MERLSPFTHSRNIPATARTAQNHTAFGAFLPMNMPSMGVRIMYSVVMNPPFPTVVIVRPYCWSVEAMVSAAPHARPPMMVVLTGSGLRSALGIRPRIISITGTSITLPMMFREPLKVSGPMKSIPACCDTNAMPHIIAAVRSSRQFLNFFEFVIFRFPFYFF